MKVEKVNDHNIVMLVNLLKNVKGLKIENHIVNNCHLLLTDNDDISGTISFEIYGKYALIRYFIFKKNINYQDILLLYESLEQELKENDIKEAIAIINSTEVKDVFISLGFAKINEDNVYFDETLFKNSTYKNNEIFSKKITF